jgi:hypothetical protein
MLELRHGEGGKMMWKNLILRGILSLIPTTIFDVLFLRYCYDPLLKISFYLAFMFYFSLSILITVISVIFFFDSKKISELFGKDMKQTLIDHGNITG